MKSYEEHLKDRSEALKDDDVITAINHLYQQKIINDDDIQEARQSNYPEKIVKTVALKLASKNTAIANRLNETQTIPEKINLLSHQLSINTALSLLATIVAKDTKSSLNRVNQYLLTK